MKKTTIFILFILLTRITLAQNSYNRPAPPVIYGGNNEISLYCYYPNVDSILIYIDTIAVPTTLVATIPGGKQTYTDSLLIEGTYYCRIKLKVGEITSNYSPIVSDSVNNYWVYFLFTDGTRLKTADGKYYKVAKY